MTTTFHCDKVCSCDTCLPLRSGLAMRIDWRAVLKTHNDPIMKASGAHEILSAVATMKAVYAAIDDPAKLAELMATGLRARGFDVACDWSDRHDFYVAWWPNDPQCADGTQWIHVRAGRYGRFKDMPTSELDMPTARAKLLAIMHTPANETSRDECERIIRGTT